MPNLGKQPLYRHCGVGLLRAAAVPALSTPAHWPYPSDTEACRTWMRQIWSQPKLADAIRQASPGLAERIAAICVSDRIPAKQVRRATLSAVRYVLRVTGRHTPLGLFAGVAPAAIGAATKVRWGTEHGAVARADSQWLADLIDQLEADPDVLDRLDVMFTNLAIRRGSRLEAPQGPNRASIRYTSVVEAVRTAAASPIQFGVLVDKLTETFAGVGTAKTRALLTDLVQQGFLITCLRSALTITDPLADLLDRLNDSRADIVPIVASLLRELEVIGGHLSEHNQASATDAERANIRLTLTDRTRDLSLAGRTPLTVDLRLDCEVQLPDHLAREVEWAASALIRLSRQPTGEAVWRDYYTAFCERFGTGGLVPLADVVHPDAGLGLPHGYPGSVMPAPTSGSSERDEKLLTLAWQAMADDRREIVLTDEIIDSLTVGDPTSERSIPPHVELAARVHATSMEALDRGNYMVTVAPARSIGTLTGRFTTVGAGSGLDDLYETVPTAIEGALPVQLSFPPMYVHAENICRVPVYLPHVVSLGEYRGYSDATIPLDDLAITASRTGLYLVSISRQRVLEPQVFHALALEKQPPPLARFLAHLSRGLCAAWTEFDWGQHAARLPYLPRVRYERSVLSPVRWRLSADDLPGHLDGSERHDALERWRQRWRCPEAVELRDADRSLPLTLTEPAHVAIVQAHLRRHGHATFTETVKPGDLGWIGGHAHDVVLPLVTTQQAASSPLTNAPALPVVTNTHGQLPGSPGRGWLYAKLYTHPERMDEILAEHLPQLLASRGLENLGYEPDCWFIRYRSLHERDHLRLRIRTIDREQHGTYVTAVGDWAQQLRDDGVVGRLAYDTYYPEIGRYGEGSAMTAAEDVFVADSQVVVAQLRHLPGGLIHPSSLTALNMVATAAGFLGNLDAAASWMAQVPAPTGIPDRAITDEVTALVRQGMLDDILDIDAKRDGDVDQVGQAWQVRTAALATYRAQLPTSAGLDAILEALLHMHHNRALGIDRESEAICRRLARQAALAWTAKHGGDRP